MNISGNCGHGIFYFSKPANCISKLFSLKRFSSVFIKPLVSREAELCKHPVTVVSTILDTLEGRTTLQKDLDRLKRVG